MGDFFRMARDGGDVMAARSGFGQNFAADIAAGADQGDFHDGFLFVYRRGGA